jgi:hypothetical protein
MSFYFLVNNFHFAFGVIGAIIFLMMAWLTFDSYTLQKNNHILSRFLGFTFIFVWQMIRSFNVNNDVLSYIGFIIFIIGLILVLASFLENKKLVANAVIVIPAFSLFSSSLYIVSTVLLLVIACLSFLQWKKEYNKTWIPFSIGFALLAIPYIINVFWANMDQVSVIYIISSVVELAAFCVLGYWLWQYMKLRIRESFVMISVGVVFLLATIVTLAFSTILIGRVSDETSSNLLSDVKVLSFYVDSIKEESLAKSEVVSLDKDLIDAVQKKDFVELEKIGEDLLEKYKLGFLTITDTDGSVLLRAHALSSRGDTISGERILEEALLGNPTVSIEDSKIEGFSVRAGSPVMYKDAVIAVVVVGTQIDNAFADKLEKLTGLETFIYNKDVSFASSAFDSDGRTRLVGETLANDEVKKAVLDEGGIITGSSKIYGTLFHSSYAPLLNSDDKIVGMLSVSKPQQDIVNIANATNRLTLITVTLIIIVLSLPIYFISKRYTDDE